MIKIDHFRSKLICNLRSKAGFYGLTLNSGLSLANQVVKLQPHDFGLGLDSRSLYQPAMALAG